MDMDMYVHVYAYVWVYRSQNHVLTHADTYAIYFMCEFMDLEFFCQLSYHGWTFCRVHLCQGFNPFLDAITF